MTSGDGPAVVLVGPPGADVPAVAVALGRLLGLPVVDTDTEVERAAGTGLAEVFVERGETEFRELERAAVVAALAGHPGVLALGGGAPADPRTEQDLAGHRVVFLDVGIADAARRLGFNRDRPAGLGNPRAHWLRLMEQRRPLYRRVATGTVSTDGLTPDQVAAAVAQLLAGTVPPDPAADRGQSHPAQDPDPAPPDRTHPTQHPAPEPDERP